MKLCVGCGVSSDVVRKRGGGMFVGGYCEGCREGVDVNAGDVDSRLIGMPRGFSLEVDEEIVRRDLERLSKRVVGSRARVRFCGCGAILEIRRTVCDECKVKKVRPVTEFTDRLCKCGERLGKGRKLCDGCRDRKVEGKGRIKKTVEDRLLSLPEEKVCNGCGELKDATAFYVTKNGYLTSRCRKCIYKINVMSRNATSERREKYLLYNREYHRKYDSNKNRGKERRDRFNLDKLFYVPQP